MMMAMRITRVLLGAGLAAFLAAGCEFSTVENLGDVSLNELQGIQATPVTPDSGNTDDSDDGDTPSQPITGGEGIGPVGEGGGFLWKPVSDSSGKLVVLLPPQYTGQVSAQYVASPDGTPIEQGSFSAVGNGGREHFRYSKPGGGYPNGSHAVANLKAGGAVHWTVPNTSARTSY